MNRNLEALLRWSVENSTRPEDATGPVHDPSTAVAPIDNGANSSSSALVLQNEPGHGTVATSSSSNTTTSPSASTSKLDPGILDAIMGKSDAARMLDCVKDLKSEGQFSLEQKLNIWDELELLVENIDNANDLTNMKLWQPIADFLADPEEGMRLQSCWVLGTAIQNNPQAQKAFLALDPLPRLLELLQSDPSADIRSKAIYAISGALRHNPPAVVHFSELGGWSALASGLRDPSISLRRKAAFLIHSLFMNTTALEEAKLYNVAAQKAGIHSTLLDSLSIATAVPTGENGESEEIDVDYSDKAVNALLSIVNKAGEGKLQDTFDGKQQNQLKSLVCELEKDNRIPSDLASAEWSSFQQAVNSA